MGEEENAGKPNIYEACHCERCEVKGKEVPKTQFSLRRQGRFQERNMPRNQGPPSPKLLEREDEGIGENFDQSRINPQYGASNGQVHHQRCRELPRG